jgi:uncharacterized protein with von Willebrand factor type A (vWA) domain
MDRHRRHQPLRPRRLQPAGHPHRRAGQEPSAVKVWEQRAYRDYDDTQELGTRNIKVALRRLRKFARQGSELELDLPTPSAARPPTPAIWTSRWCPSATTT